MAIPSFGYFNIPKSAIGATIARRNKIGPTVPAVKATSGNPIQEIKTTTITDNFIQFSDSERKLPLDPIIKTRFLEKRKA
jgi:hypothetical protein